MPINLQGSGNIAEGWGAAPQLHAPELGSLVGNILRERLARQELTQKSIADAIKNFQEQRQSSAYLDAAQQAGILPEGDLGPLGVKGASLLAQEILRKKEADARAAHLAALTAHVGSGRGRGGGGGDDAGYPETTWDEQGREWRKGPAGRWIPVKPVVAPKDPSQIQPTRAERANAAPTIPGLTVYPDQTAETLPPDIPPASDVSPTPPPADQNVAKGYGTDATSMSADDIRTAYKAGKMTVEEAKARLKAIGFSD